MRLPGINSIALIALIAMVGCTPRHGEATPDTQPVQGKVIFKDGKTYDGGGQIELRTRRKRVSAGVKSAS